MLSFWRYVFFQRMMGLGKGFDQKISTIIREMLIPMCISMYFYLPQLTWKWQSVKITYSDRNDMYGRP